MSKVKLEPEFPQTVDHYHCVLKASIYDRKKYLCDHYWKAEYQLTNIVRAMDAITLIG